MPPKPDYYQILQVDPSAEPDVIAATYRRLARKYHPDVSADPAAGAKMTRLNEAYEILSNPESRRRYDTERLSRRASLSHRQPATERPKRAPPQPKETVVEQTRCLLCETMLSDGWGRPTPGQPVGQGAGRRGLYVCYPCWSDWQKKPFYVQQEILDEHDPEVQALPLRKCEGCGKDVRSLGICNACLSDRTNKKLCMFCGGPLGFSSPGCRNLSLHTEAYRAERERDQRREDRQIITGVAVLAITYLALAAVIVGLIVAGIIFLG